MEKIIKSYNSIDKVLEKNRKVTLFIISMSFLTCIIMGVLIYRVSKNNVMAVDKDGDIVSLTRTTEAEMLTIEADNHVRLFYDRFFSYNKSNYKQQVELGLHLAGISGKRLYETYNQKQWYSNVVNNDLLIQSKVLGDIEFSYDNGQLYFYSKGLQKISRGEIVEYRHLDLRAKIVKNNNGRIRKLNPHGMIIDNIVILDNDRMDGYKE
ncbi:hypothetical protein [Maribacter sp.]|uniref:hypothetical protein n=1 Tax=Maribacter sp. TaxID=1897614 RepID=UPI0025C07022|nr:hypothetical protein [Maribacter sp.]|tara:strand:+ start:25688 stop:26314 length:627 start_codon:yes stop_codon:yes gene_type:complete